MSRTPAMSALALLASLGRDAAAAGADIEAVDDARREAATSEARLTRRDALKHAALAGAATTAVGRVVLHPERAWEARKPSSQPSVLVVGAGISGLSAAMTLRDAGFTNLTVFDAEARVGGRTFTRRDDGFFEAGQWVEWGGELIDSSHSTILSLCRRFGFRLIDLDAVSPRDARETLYFGGGYYPWSEMLRDWQAAGAAQTIRKQMRSLPAWPWSHTATWSKDALALSRMTVAQWIDAFVPGGRQSRLGQFIDVAYTIEFGEETTRMSALNLLGLLGFSNGGGTRTWWVYGESDERWKVVGGNQQITEALADHVGRDRLRLGWRMTSVRRNDNATVTATFDVGGRSETVTGDRLILAVPLGVMKRIRADGGFAGSGFDTDARKMGSIDALGFGANNKLQLQIRNRFWSGPGPWGNSNGESFGDTGYQLAWAATAGQPGTTGIINNYTGGDVARRLDPPVPFSDTSSTGPAGDVVRSAAQTFLAQIEPVYPGMTAGYTGTAQLSAWHVAPSSLGAYSYWTPGYNERYCTVERRPARPIHFAGEHCSQDFQGYIQGGADEGIRAAKEIIADYR